MAKAMKKLGIKQDELQAQQVIIVLEDKELVFNNPQISKVDMMGQVSYQIVGTPEERSRTVSISEEDVKTVMEQTRADKKSAEEAIKKHKGDLASAILELQS
ncbi:nascent polypeptide-associated complex protein [Candidatus Woesearchaeota archaeon]|nr:nascent polypeptide-associated complex protein [Candidatus Woesearchaeota archaeon]